MSHPPSILGLGLATPATRVDWRAAAAIACDLSGAQDGVRARIHRLFERSGVETRGSVSVDGRGEPVLFRLKGALTTTGERMAAYEASAAELCTAAADAALRDGGVAPDTITHVVTASCTGFSAPGFDLSMIRRLGLRPGVQRTHIGFMGCHGAINALRVASALAREGAVVLVACVELCTLHFDGSGRPDGMVANALFADGAAACVVGVGAGPRIAATGSVVLPETEGEMRWRIGDYGFPMTLSARVPDLIGGRLGGWMAEWLASHGLTPGEIRGWCVHPGGPKVLDATEDALGLARGDLADSRAVLREHGNMSSATVLFILKRAREAGRLPAVLLAFGPGLTIEAALLA